MKVSIVTVCFNSERTIERTIKSVIGQTYHDIEYIVVDGGSTDGTRHIIKKYQESIAVCVSERDDGVFDAMNKGIKLATGEIIGMINSDDYYAEDAVERVVDCFKKKNADIVHGDFIILSKDGSIKYRSSPEFFTYEQSFTQAVFCHPTVFVKKDVYEKHGGFNSTYKIVGDYDLLLNYKMAGLQFEYLSGDIAFFQEGGLCDTKRMWKCMTELRKASIGNIEKYKNNIIVRYLELVDEHYTCRRKRSLEIFLTKRMEKYYALESSVYLDKVLNDKKNIVIFGAGYDGRECVIWLRSKGIEVMYFVDNARLIQNTLLEGLIVKKPEELLRDKENTMVLISPNRFYCEIKQQLDDMGKLEYQDYVSFEELRNNLQKNYVKNKMGYVLKARKHAW